jgi:hypothetical protein
MHSTSKWIPTIEFVPPKIGNAAATSGRATVAGTSKAMDVYAPYTCLSRSFDDRNIREALKGTTIRPIALRGYLDRILEYCLATEWGKAFRRAA